MGQALHLVGHGVDIVPVDRNHATVVVVNLLLQNVIHLLALGRIRDAADLDEDLVEFWILVVGLVPGRIRLEGECHHNVGGRTHVPGHDAHRRLQPYRAPVAIGGDLLDVDIHADLGGFTLQEQALVDCAWGNFCSHNRNGSVADAGLVEVILCFVWIQHPLRDVRAMVKIGLTDGLVVAERCLALVDAFHETLTIHQVLHRHDQVVVARHVHVLAACDVDVGA